MTIEEYGRAMFHVTSHGETLIVDLMPHNTNGCCNCRHFLGRLKPLIDEDKALKEFKPGKKYQCPHILFAREYLLNKFLTELKKQFPEADTEI